jgi:ActR/RegA family two-component response regulator
MKNYALVIDDHVAFLESLARAAEFKGLEVIPTTTWEDGLALFHIHGPELVIADYNLPGSRRGLQLLADIRRLRPSTRLVLISGVIDAGDAKEIETDAKDVVDRVLLKLDAAELTPALLDEIASARDRAEKSTNWRDYGRAYGKAEGVSQKTLDQLDTRLQERRGLR